MFDTHKTRIESLGYRVVKKLWQYVEVISIEQ